MMAEYAGETDTIQCHQDGGDSEDNRCHHDGDPKDKTGSLRYAKETALKS